MEKIIHKLDKISRYKIAINYVNDIFATEIAECNVLADLVANTLISNFHKNSTSLSVEKFNSLCNTMENMNLTSDFFDGKYSRTGEVVLNLESGGRYSRGLPFRVYESNCFKYVNDDDFNYTLFKNVDISQSKVVYSNLIKKNDLDELTLLESKYNELNNKMLTSFNTCYELLKRVRTSELLMKHWSNAYKYLPDDIAVDEPQTLTISEKFKLL